MGFRMIAPKRLRKAKTKNSKEILNRLEEYLKSVTVTGEFVKVLCGFWEDQQNAITYQELRQIVQDGSVEQETLQLWAQDYSILVANQLNGMWMDAVIAGSKGQPILDNLTFEFNSQSSGILNWIKERGAEFVTASSQEQKSAIAALLLAFHANGISPTGYSVNDYREHFQISNWVEQPLYILRYI